MPTLFWTNEDTGALELVKFDAVSSIDHDDTVTITDHPVEEGVNVSDHARDEPERVSLEGWITNTPHLGNLGDEDDHELTLLPFSFETMGDPGTKQIKLEIPGAPVQLSPAGLIQAGIGAISSAVFGPPNSSATVRGEVNRVSRTASAQVLQSASSRDRVRDAYEKLLGALRNKNLITVQTGNREYFDMLIERVGQPRAVEDGTAARFQVDLRRLRIAESETVQSPEPAEVRGALGKSLGSQAAKPDPNAAAKEAAARESIAYSAAFGSG